MRNQFKSRCFLCGKLVHPHTGITERARPGLPWKTRHAIRPGGGRIVCDVKN